MGLFFKKCRLIRRHLCLIKYDYLLSFVFSHCWLAIPQLVLQADWQDVWHSPQPPFLALSQRFLVSKVSICFMVKILQVVYVYYDYNTTNTISQSSSSIFLHIFLRKCTKPKPPLYKGGWHGENLCVQMISYARGVGDAYPYKYRDFIRTNNIVFPRDVEGAVPYKYRDFIRTNNIVFPRDVGDAVPYKYRDFIRTNDIVFPRDVEGAVPYKYRGFVRTNDIVFPRDVEGAVPYKYRDFIRTNDIVFPRDVGDAEPYKYRDFIRTNNIVFPRGVGAGVPRNELIEFLGFSCASPSYRSRCYVFIGD